MCWEAGLDFVISILINGISLLLIIFEMIISGLSNLRIFLIFSGKFKNSELPAFGIFLYEKL